MNLQTSNANIRHLLPKHCHRINQPVCSIKTAPPIVLKANPSVKKFSRGGGRKQAAAVAKMEFLFLQRIEPTVLEVVI